MNNTNATVDLFGRINVDITVSGLTTSAKYRLMKDLMMDTGVWDMYLASSPDFKKRFEEIWIESWRKTQDLEHGI